MGSLGEHMKWGLGRSSLGSWCRWWYNRFFSCLGYSIQPITKYYFPHRTLFFHFISPQLIFFLGFPLRICFVVLLDRAADTRLMYSYVVVFCCMYTVKRVIDFLVSSRDVTYQSLPGRDILAGDGKIANLFLQCFSMHET
jgi:hypothetical protein